MLKRLIQTFLLSGMTALLIACGGGGGSSGSSTTSLSGVAAVGVALANASVTLKDSTGKTETTTTDESGNFTFKNVSSFTPPLMLQVKGSAAGVSYVLHSLMTSTPAQGDHTLNVTPATDAVTTQTLGADPVVTFNDAEKIKKIEPAKLAEAKAKLVAALKDALTNLKIDNLDVMTGKFAADKTGMDKLFDLVEFSPNSTTGEIKLTNKNTRSSTTVNSNAKPSEVTQLGLSKDEASLDLSGIDKFVQSFIKAVNDKDKTAFSQLLDSAYLDQGTDLEMAKAGFSTNSAKLAGAGYAVKKCDPSTKICSGTLNIKISGVTYPQFMPIKLGTDGKWRAYGDQAPFDIDFYPIYIHSETIDSTTKNIAQTKDTVGISLNFSGDSCSKCNDKKYKSSIFEMSIDGGKNYSLLFKLKSKTITNSDNSTYFIPMGLDDEKGNVIAGEWIDALGPYFRRVENTSTISAYNTAFQAGQLKLRITAYTNDDYSGTAATWEPQILAPLFNPSNFDAMLNEHQLTIDKTTLGTDAVSFAGKNLVDSYFSAYTTNTQSYSSYGEYFSFDEASALNGVVTPAKLKAQCDKNLPFMTKQTDIDWKKSQCNALASSGLKIDQAILISQNPQGGRVHLGKRLGYVSSSTPVN